LQLRHRPHEQRLVMFQAWQDLLFLHWKYSVEEIQRTLPSGLWVDSWDGHAWVGVVPFTMSGVRPRGLPAIPGLSSFPELNVRTYVHDRKGTPGVWFYSLDASQWAAVKLARWWFGLPYYHARMRVLADPESIDYESCRRGTSAACHFRYRPGASVAEAEAGSLEFFLIERYLLYTRNRGRLQQGRVHHRPYPLRSVAVEHWSDALIALAGIRLAGRPPEHALYSKGVQVEVFQLQDSGR